MRKWRVVHLTLTLLLLSSLFMIGLTATSAVNDVTPPEAVITFNPDPQKLRIEVSGVDDADPEVEATSVVLDTKHDKTTIRYTLTDDAGNYMNMTLELKEKKGHAEVEILELNYNGEQVFVPEENRYSVHWQHANHPLKHLHQKIKLHDQFNVKTQYQAKKNETKIDIKVEGEPKEKIVLPGLVIVSLVTDKGNLNYEIEFIDSVPPEIVWVFFETPTYDEYAVIRAYVTDIGTGVDFVTLSYSADSIGSGDLTMDLVDEFYVSEIPPFPYNTEVRFVISAYDKAGNPAIPWEDSYTVTDARQPTISFVERTPVSPNYNESVTIIANVTDNRGSRIDSVILRYSIDSVNWTNLPMVMTNELYTAEILAYPYDTVVLYEVYANDTAGNSADSLPSFYRVIDSFPPEISDLERTPTLPEYDEIVTVFVDVTEPPDASNVGLVILSYWDGSAWENTTMTLAGTQYTATVPMLPYGTAVQYKVYAFDNAWNRVVSDAQLYQVTDNTPPSIGTPFAWRPSQPFAEEQVSVSVLVTEPLGASGVKNVTLWYDAEEGRKSVEMTLTSGNWTAIIPGQDADVTVMFYIESYDNAGNRALTLTYHYTTQAQAGWPLSWLAVIILLIIALTVTAIYVLYSRRKRRTGTKLENKSLVTLYVPEEALVG